MHTESCSLAQSNKQTINGLVERMERGENDIRSVQKTLGKKLDRIVFSIIGVGGTILATLIAGIFTLISKAI